MKKSISIRWVRSLHASVDGVYDEYVGLLETLNRLAEEKGSGEAMAKGLAKKLKRLNGLSKTI